MDEESIIGRLETPPRAFIYTGGSVLYENISEYERPRKGDLCIAADCGYKHALELSVKPDLLIGDFDSIGNDTELPSDIERITLPCEKDCTDTQAAFCAAVERGYDTIVIIGGMGTRLDHSLSSFEVSASIVMITGAALLSTLSRLTIASSRPSILVKSIAPRYL